MVLRTSNYQFSTLLVTMTRPLKRVALSSNAINTLTENNKNQN